MPEEAQDSAVDLYWIPLGAGGRSVRWNGRLFEAAIAWREHRAAEDLYHAALEVREQGRRYVIEMGPVWNIDDADRGVVCAGPVGMSWSVPSLTWGRDEFGAGDMWNSNSLISWLLARSGHDLTKVCPPIRGLAPGWQAGLVLASRQGTTR